MSAQAEFASARLGPMFGLFAPTRLLRRILWLDASISFAGALPFIVAPGLLSDWFSLPAPLLYWVGIALVPLAALIAFFASRPMLPPVAVWLVIGGNFIYTIACAWLLFHGPVSPNIWGEGLIIAHGLLTLVLGELEFFALHRARRSEA